MCGPVQPLLLKVRNLGWAQSAVGVLLSSSLRLNYIIDEECFQTCSLCPVLASVIRVVIATLQDYAAWDIRVQSLQIRVPFTVSLFHIF